MIYKVERMASSKKYASEDSSFWMEDGDVIVAGVFDGCGGAQESHFASNLFMRAFRRIIKYKHDDKDYNMDKTIFIAIIYAVCMCVKEIADSLTLTFFQLQSTVVFAYYDKTTKVLCCSILGDGFIHYRDAEGWHHIDLHLPENAPDYLGYYVLENEDKLYENIEAREFHIIEGVEEWSIGTDGIDSIRQPKDTQHMLEWFLEDDSFYKSEAMLERKTNILLKTGAQLGDDLTIIRYIPDESTNTVQTASDSDKDSSTAEI